MEKGRKKNKLSRSFQQWLLLLVAAMLLVTLFLLWAMEKKVTEDITIALMRQHIIDVRKEIVDSSNEEMLELTEQLGDQIEEQGAVDDRMLSELAQTYDVSEIHLVGADGHIRFSTNRKLIGYDMVSDTRSAEFLVLLDDTTSFTQSYQPSFHDPYVFRKYAGVALASGGFILTGYDAGQLSNAVADRVVSAARNRHIGQKGGILIADRAGRIVSGMDQEGMTLEQVGLSLQDRSADVLFRATVGTERCYCLYLTAEGYYAVAVLPEYVVSVVASSSVAVTAVLQLISLVALAVMIWFLTRKLVVLPILHIGDALSKIGQGDLDVVADARSHVEFDALSRDINTTVDTLKRYISEAEGRIDAELAMAKQIQRSTLTSVFPDRPQIDVWAYLNEAKEVGGDFYDLYPIDGDTIAFTVADVSGKGIPAAMFMMRAKTVLKGLAQSGLPVEEVLTKANEQLCQDNDAGMFVTVWMGILDIRNGRLTFGDAGHGPCLLSGRDGHFRPLRKDAELMLGVEEDIRYSQCSTVLLPGATLFLCTDGVSESMDLCGQRYGPERLREQLDRHLRKDAKEICLSLAASVKDFVGDAPQFDDITMLCLRFTGVSERRQLKLDATVEQIPVAVAFVEEIMEQMGCRRKDRYHMDVVVDEILSNIAKYACGPEIGTVTLLAEVMDGPKRLVLTFTDPGVPFDPLEVGMPELELDLEERELGGLGIHLVRSLTDKVTYQRIDGNNVLCVEKYMGTDREGGSHG